MMYLEVHPSLHLVSEHVCDALVEVLENAHRKLRFNAAGGNEVVKSVGEGETDSNPYQSIWIHTIAGWW